MFTEEVTSEQRYQGRESRAVQISIKGAAGRGQPEQGPGGERKPGSTQACTDLNHNHVITMKSKSYFHLIAKRSLFLISWRLITLQYCSGFCHTLTWISHGFTCVPHPEPPSRIPPHPIPLGHPSAPAPSTCLMHPTWTGDLFHTW